MKKKAKASAELTDAPRLGWGLRQAGFKIVYRPARWLDGSGFELDGDPARRRIVVKDGELDLGEEIPDTQKEAPGC